MCVHINIGYTCTHILYMCIHITHIINTCASVCVSVCVYVCARAYIQGAVYPEGWLPVSYQLQGTISRDFRVGVFVDGVALDVVGSDGVCVCMCVYVYVHSYTDTCTHIHTHTHAHTHTRRHI